MFTGLATGLVLTVASILLLLTAYFQSLRLTLVALATVEVPSYAANELPPELAALPAEEPGSKRLRA